MPLDQHLLERLPKSNSSSQPENPKEARLRLLRRCERIALSVERELIQEILPLLYEFVASLGCTPRETKPERIHFYDTSELDGPERAQLTEASAAGAYRPVGRLILVFSPENPPSPLDTANTLVHEMLHDQAFSNIEEEWRRYADRASTQQRQERIGLRIIRPDKGTTYFENLDEAVITELTIRFLDQYGHRIPVLTHELQSRSQFVEALPEDLRERARQDIARVVQAKDDERGRWKTELIQYPYPRERKELKRLVTDLQVKNSVTFADHEEVFQLFVHAVLKGNLLPLARLVERTYGRGSFRRIGERYGERGGRP